MSMLWLKHVPESLREDVDRLLEISPLFVSLMRTVDAEDCHALFRSEAEAVLPDGGQNWVPDCTSDDLSKCMRHLRLCKQRGMRHIIWWEMGLHGDIEVSYRAIADFASGLLEQALVMAERLITSRFGHLDGGRFCVIGLGKLGGHELNLGSDVDPLFIWQGKETTSGGRAEVTATEYYNHLSRMLIRLMSEHTEDGMVWLVDMRLRPGGDGAAICLSLDATVEFYQNYGQTWERAMLIKARPVAGDKVLGDAFVVETASFIYRRYLDYTTVAALADMKRRIDAYAGDRKIGAGFDVKRGSGGIREIEFIVQSMQLLHGGLNPQLRQSPCMLALEALCEFGAIREDEAAQLHAAYRFWRRVEHAVQARVGEQTQKLPEGYVDYLESALGVSGIQACMDDHAVVVGRVFAEHVLPIAASEEVSWLNGDHDAELSHLDAASRNRVTQALAAMDEHLLRGMLPERSRKRVEAVLARAMPIWLSDTNGVTALEAFSDLLKSIAGRATWIDLLATHQGALDWLIGALSASRYVREHIVCDPSWLEWPLAHERGASDVQAVCHRMGQIDVSDTEQALVEIGHLVDRVRLTAALSVDAHQVGPETVGAWMADTADAATQVVLRLCLKQMQLPQDFPFVALAMGKHGSREMGLVSDLDMVFVLADEQPERMLGKRSMWEHAQRLGRHMIQQLSGQRPYGASFEFDARLRPSGRSGTLVTSLNGFRDYQLHHAQSWEHQALCRARTVAGPAAAQKAVGGVVDEVLNLKWDAGKLAWEVMAMRRKMLDHLASKSGQMINLKQDAGGLVDIEFLAQYGRLVFGGNDRGTVEVLRHMASMNDVPEVWRTHADWLAKTYLDYRQMENALRVELWQSIGRLSVDATCAEWETMRRHAAISSPEQLRDTMKQVHVCFKQLLHVK
ncbi:MAG: bifunctional [glutamate--ammonia ligase]-adenylyl-L-tyrosine phosphorylase/[glutamate--ammonia-ligase] adenylyltransferase [Mariprofundaceae bacterium]|nr:bifunctional [glutamate--ammonia ligase]-adenylyl-L-tyrosine phosphorylase/[glutamate--ammonia-ligase] adenylyltransferase [Mariprofundaceae bacterium]